ncbi:serine kinase [Dyella choica]|uniref:serine kinase n=1 Tax=Dyella choica TaxID=1927959 RepID=UPI0013157468|nr:serine kinase [Dyella choica]
MASHPQPVARDLCADPFSERYPRHLSVHQQLLGGSFLFESDSQALLDLVVAAFGELPPHCFPGIAPELRVELRLVPERNLPNAGEPPPVQLQSGLGLLLGVINSANYVVISPAQRQALIVVSEDMLEFSYHLRYELIEFAVYVLATRCQGLVPLHGACVGREGRGILLLGDSGAGKSTLTLHGLLQGLDFLAEDAVFVQPESMLATGIANYLHVKADGLPLLDSEAARSWIGGSAVIRRRSGVEKFEADLRLGDGRLAAEPLKLVGAVFASAEVAENSGALLRPIPKDEIAARLRADQPYASGQAGWLHFQQKLVRMGVHELRRGAHPRAAVEALHALLDRPSG